jgi:uncharacterized LabA/DUF88 family protein
MTSTCRVAFIVDGFNVYHSIEEAVAKGGYNSLKWLDLRSLCASYLSTIDRSAILEGVYYFSAPATHRDPATVKRHMIYCACLTASGVTVEMSRFRPKDVRCPKCKKRFVRHEEKETDVAIAAKLLELTSTDCSDAVVLVSGDTDLLPAIRTVTRLYPGKRILMGFPHARFSKELRAAASASFKIKAKACAAHQFPATVRLSDGREIHKPPTW